MKKPEILGITFSLILAGFSAVIGTSTVYRSLLLTFAALLGGGLLVKYYFDNKTSIILNSAKSKQFATEIYEYAAESGGSLKATHIFPRGHKSEEDLAVKILRKPKPNIHLNYERVLIVDKRVR